MEPLPEFDAEALRMRSDRKEAEQAAPVLREAFEYHMLRTGAFNLAMRDTRLIARDRLGFKSDVSASDCIFYKPGSSYRVHMTQGEHGCFDFNVEAATS